MHRKQLESIPRENGTMGKRTVIKMGDLKTVQLFFKVYILHTGDVVSLAFLMKL